MATIKFKNAQGQWEELSAAKLETARNINGVPFDGTQDITIPTGSSDYQGLSNKPQINGIELDGNKTLDDLSIEPKRGADDFYVTNAEKTQGALATGNAALDTVKKVADRTDRLLVDFTVPVDTASIITFDRDKNGVLFSDLNLKSVNIIFNITTNSNRIVVRKLIINNIITNTYNQNSSLADAIAFPFSAYASGVVAVNIIADKLIYNLSGFYAESINPPSNNAVSTYNGFNTTNNIAKINLITINISNFLFLSGSSVKIYRND